LKISVNLICLAAAFMKYWVGLHSDSDATQLQQGADALLNLALGVGAGAGGNDAVAGPRRLTNPADGDMEVDARKMMLMIWTLESLPENLCSCDDLVLLVKLVDCSCWDQNVLIKIGCRTCSCPICERAWDARWLLTQCSRCLDWFFCGGSFAVKI
jgi:hypothetical protein